MNYCSTRNTDLKADSIKAVLDGIAPDGGLYITDPSLLSFDWKKAINSSPREMSAMILSALLPDFPDMDKLVENSYRNKFETDDLTPVVKVGNRYVLELFRGPTFAFKDVALSVLPHLVTAGRKLRGEEGETVILTATSGDTGKAALEGFHDVDGTRIIVFYPYGGVSRVQELQMRTQKGTNVKVCAVRGNFDDAQTGVKNVFAACHDEDLGGNTLSSANSINIGRLAPQVMYYFKAYADICRSGGANIGDKVNFVVPTGNFGDILAGYFAKLMGLPVGKLICASNQNNILTDFISTGVYDKRREFYKTYSPSMDILVSSNLERLLFLLSRDGKYVEERMKKLSSDGCYSIGEDMLAKLKAEMDGGYCTDIESIETIGKVFREYSYLMDSHTAVAWNVADKCGADTFEGPVVVLSTASPFKFSAACLRALGEEPSDDEFAVMDRLSEITGVPAPNGLSGLRKAEILHSDVINKEDMLRYVLDYIKS